MCGKAASKLSKVGETTSRGLATGLAAWLMNSFGLANPIALGMAATILVILGTASKKAFCKMTEDEVLKSFGIDL